MLLLYIIYFPILIKSILVSDLLSEVLVLENCDCNCRVFSLVDILLLDINLRKQFPFLSTNNFILFSQMILFYMRLVFLKIIDDLQKQC